MAIRTHSAVLARRLRRTVPAIIRAIAWIRSVLRVIVWLDVTPHLTFNIDCSHTVHAPRPSRWDDFALWETEFATMDGPS